MDMLPKQNPIAGELHLLQTSILKKCKLRREKNMDERNSWASRIQEASPEDVQDVVESVAADFRAKKIMFTLNDVLAGLQARGLGLNMSLGREDVVNIVSDMYGKTKRRFNPNLPVGQSLPEDPAEATLLPESPLLGLPEELAALDSASTNFWADVGGGQRKGKSTNLKTPGRR